MFENIEAPDPIFEEGQEVYHMNRREWVTITEVGGASEKRWNDYGVVEREYFAVNDEGEYCWGYENDFSHTSR
jgi:hypothetical protein